MIRSIKDLMDYKLHAIDGDIGKVVEFYFDDTAWTVRYMVVDAGTWLQDRLVLISPIAVSSVNWDTHELEVSLTRDQVQRSPDIDTHQPISRQNEEAFHKYYGWPFYWAGEGLWGGAMVPGALYGVPFVGSAVDVSREEKQAENLQEQPPGGEQTAQDSHLRATRDVLGYRIQARDGEIGHLSDMLIDDESWRINYMVIDTSNWLIGKKVIVPPTWVTDVSWADQQVTVDLDRDTVKNSPEFNPETIVNRA